MMSGLNLGVGGGIGSGGVRFGGVAAAQPAMIVQTAYGTQSARASQGGGIEPWHFGVAVPAALVGFGVFLRWSLPEGRKSEFDLAAITSAVTVFGLGALARLWSAKELNEGQPGFGNSVAQVVHATVG
ncbi:MAG: hypothetical protein M0Z69_12345 [Actinomycetota bacterium]|nr:hypothetical protein [Actinomycetota bacterium]